MTSWDRRQLHCGTGSRSAQRLAGRRLGPRLEASGGVALVLPRDRGGAGRAEPLGGESAAAAHPALRLREGAGADQTSILTALNTLIK